MKFTSKMNGWGKAGVIIFYAAAAIFLLEIVMGVASPSTFGGMVGLAIAAFVSTKVDEEKVTNGTYFCTVLSPVLGLIAHLINGNPSKKKTDVVGQT